MANIRTLKLNLLADTTDFASGIKRASGQTDGFGTSVKKSMANIARSAALAGAAVGSMAVAFGVQAVKAAAEDQKSQIRLQNTLKNTTKATDKQRQSVEKWITKQQFAYGFTDTKLRAGLERLSRATGSVKKSQDLLNIAMDIAAGTGKDLDTVTQALARAQGGNLTALKRLGIPLDENTIKTKNLNAAMKIAADTFKGSASTAAGTFAGKMEIFKQRLDEAKESIGVAILTALQPMADKWLPKIADGVTSFVNGLTGANGLNSAIATGSEAAYKWGTNLRKAVDYLIEHKDGLGKIAAITAGIFLGAKAGMAIQGMITAVRSLIGVYQLLTVSAATAAGAEAAATGGASFYAAIPAITAIATAFGIAALMGLGGPTKGKPKGAAAGAVTSGAAQQETGVGAGGYGGVQYGTAQENSGGNGWGGGRRGFMARRSSMGGGTTIINLNGIVDAESARRSIVGVLNDSSIRTGAVNVNGSLI